MRYPAYLLEVGLPENRHKLWFSVRSGLGIVVSFSVLALLTMAWGLVPVTPLVIIPIALKLVTNSLAWWSLRAEKLVLEMASLNVTMDTVALTWAIYLTGGLESPLFAVYAIELTVVALLSNIGVTVVVMVLALTLHATMATLIYAGVVPAMAAPAFGSTEMSLVSFTIVLGTFGFVLWLPTMFTASILGDLRSKTRALEARTKELESASQAKARFIANLTHELRTPIHGISGLSDLLESGIYGPVTPKQQRAHAEVKRSARSLLTLVDGLLALAKSEDGRITPRLERVDLRDHILTVVDDVRAVVGTDSLPIDVELSDDLGGIVTDAAMLGHVVQNLVANAVKFTPDDGHVRVRARRDPNADAVILEVEDSGIGIAEADQERIFEPFQQLHDGSFVREHGGVGLGLALVRQLVSAVGGTIDVSSEVGRGSVFRVRVPSVTAAERLSA